METKEDRIIDAAWGLFIRHGYRKVSMSDIAEASAMSRPSLYASFDNKEAIFTTMGERKRKRSQAETDARLPHVKGLEARLALVFEIWIVEPAASVIDLPNGLDMLANGMVYAPGAVTAHYDDFEAQLVNILKEETSRKKPLAARDIAYILRMATMGVKASAETMPELRRLVAGLIAMAVATVRAS